MNELHEATDLLQRRMSLLKLSASVLGAIVERDPQRAVEWTYGIGNAADRLSEVAERVEALTDTAPPPPVQ